MRCDYMLPQAESGIVAYGDPLPSCLLEAGHKGEHLVLGSYGKYVVFLPYSEPCGDECACANDTNTTNYECFTWGTITNKEAQALLNPPKEKTAPHK